MSIRMQRKLLVPTEEDPSAASELEKSNSERKEDKPNSDKANEGKTKSEKKKEDKPKSERAKVDKSKSERAKEDKPKNEKSDKGLIKPDTSMELAAYTDCGIGEPEKDKLKVIKYAQLDLVEVKSENNRGVMDRAMNSMLDESSLTPSVGLVTVNDFNDNIIHAEQVIAGEPILAEPEPSEQLNMNPGKVAKVNRHGARDSLSRGIDTDEIGVSALGLTSGTRLSNGDIDVAKIEGKHNWCQLVVCRNFCTIKPENSSFFIIILVLQKGERMS